VVMDTDPHVLCFQEITPTIHMLLHGKEWYQAGGGMKATVVGSRVLYRNRMCLAGRLRLFPTLLLDTRCG
jgi:hypothetical protein